MTRALYLLALTLYSLASNALPEQCLARPTRTAPCEHLIYKKEVLARDEGSEGQIYCVCLQDFHDLLFPAKTEAERIQQQNRLRQLSAETGYSEQELLRLIRY